MSFTPPPRKLTVFLLLAVLAGPVSAQTVTTPGLVGPPACAGTGESNDPLAGSISAVTTTTVTLSHDARNNLYSELRSRAGDGGATSFPLRYRVYNARTGSQTGSQGGFATITSSNPNLASGTNAPFALTEKTPYYITVYTTASGFGESRPLLTRCFMTGGTYTPSNESGQPGFVANTTSGCFSISPLTRLDVRNCLCGRSRIWNDDTQNTTARQNLGCAN